MRKWSKYIPLYLSALIVGTVILASCQADLIDDYTSGKNGKGIQFGVSLEEQKTVYTRGAETRGTPGLDSIYVAYTPWNNDFFIQLNTTDENGVEEKEIGVYRVPSAYEGRLDPISPEHQLDWKNLDRQHTFYSWTVPWMKTSPAYLEGTSGADESDKEYYTPSADTLAVHFYNSSEQYGFNQNKNNAVLEGLIGAKSASYSYDKHGKYVELTYHHLVSRIIIESLILIQTDGSVQKDLQADMTFVGMPIQATLYPHPADELPSKYKIPKGSGPRVGGPYIESPDTGVTYYIANKAGVEDVFYICPETNFADIDFQIKINSEKYLNYDTYYGTFDEVIFEREPGWGYDQPGEDENNPADSKILHAGEEMRLNIVLIPGVGPGLKVIIRDWSTDKPNQSEYHSYPGIYSDAEIQQLEDMLFNFSQADYDNPPPELEMFYEIYGYEKDGKKYLPLYENVTPKKGNSVSNIFPIPPGYIIDGMGHTVTLKTNSGNYWNEGTSNYFNIGGLCRDIYFSDENGNNTIYIDVDGYVWITGEDGMLVKTTNKLPDEMPNGIKGFDISCRSGKIRETGYFNDKITG